MGGYAEKSEVLTGARVVHVNGIPRALVAAVCHFREWCIPAVFLASLVVGGYQGARLVERLRHERGVTHAVSWSWDPRQAYTGLVLSIDVPSTEGAAVVDEIRAALQGLVSHPPTIDEL